MPLVLLQEEELSHVTPDYRQMQDEWIDDTGKLTIQQNRQGHHQARQPERLLAANNKGIPRESSLEAVTRNRCAEDEIRSSDPLLGSPAAQSTTTRGHHTKTASGGFLITRDQELSNQGNQTSDLEYRRNIHGATTPWYDLNTDNPNTGKAFHRDEPKDREAWSNVARFWYSKAADKSPNVGRLYHHLALLARPFTLEQLSLYTRSLTCVTPFESAKGSITTLFNPILNGKGSATRRTSSFETVFNGAHDILFPKGPADSSDRCDEVMKELEANDRFDSYHIKVAARYRDIGIFAAVANEYGTTKQGVPKPIIQPAFEAFENADQGTNPNTSLGN